jgi:predicted anti-sigma-YlaC factor YlaD
VECLTCREAISARLDGEAEPAPAEQGGEVRHAAGQGHLASCAACRSWQVRVTETSRMLRVREAPEVPDLADAILEIAVPPSATRDWWARIALIAVAAAQVGLALPRGHDRILANSQSYGVSHDPSMVDRVPAVPTGGLTLNENFEVPREQVLAPRSSPRTGSPRCSAYAARSCRTHSRANHTS